MPDDDTSFPINVESKLLNFLQKVILLSVKFLACLMTLVILWAIIDLGYFIYVKAIQPPFLLVQIDDLLKTFGAFLVVLIAIEIFINIILYFKKGANHLRLVVATALMAIARKVIILDYEKTPAGILVAIGVIIGSLALAYWLMPKENLKSL